MRSLLFIFVAALLSACSETDPRFQIQPQKWNDTVVEVETRPAPVKPGMNEFLIIVTLERGKPVSDLVVSLKAQPQGEWQQAIQDGHSGVYRRALHVPGSPTLFVKLRKTRSDEQKVLEFPLLYADGA